MMRRVAITGVGTVGPAGSGLDALRSALHGATPTWSAVERSGGFHSSNSAHLAGILGDDPYAPWLSLRESRRMSPASSMAVCAAAMAMNRAGLTKERLAGPDTAVSLGTSFGSTNYTASLLQQMKDTGPLSISPLLFMETVANAHAGQVALATGANGPNYTISQREASGLLAVARGAQLVASGKATRAFVGCVDEVSPILHGMLDRFGALARPTAENDVEVARPFDARRNGFTISEGGTVFLLEEEESALARGANVLARVRATVRANDPSAPATDWGRGEAQLAQRLLHELQRQGVDPASIDRVVSGASGSRRGDRLEAQTLRAIFGADAMPPILAPKAITGEYGGGYLASIYLGLEGGAWPAPSFEHLDPELDVAPHDGSALAPAKRLLASSLAAGGAAVWLVLDAPAN